MIPPDWASEIPAGKKSMEKIAFPLEELAECGIETVEDVSFDLVVCSADEPTAQPLLHSTCTLLFKDGQPDSVRYREAEVIEEESEIDDSAEAVPVVDVGPGDRIYAGGDKIVWLRSDGTVKGAGYVEGHAQELNAWRDITSVAVASSHTMGLRKDGTIDQIGGGSKLNSDHLGDVAHIAAGKDHSVIVHSDGTVVAAGHNQYGQCNVRGWNDIVAIACGDYFTVGVRADGKVLVAHNGSHAEKAQKLAETWVLPNPERTDGLDF